MVETSTAATRGCKTLHFYWLICFSEVARFQGKHTLSDRSLEAHCTITLIPSSCVLNHNYFPCAKSDPVSSQWFPKSVEGVCVPCQLTGTDQIPYSKKLLLLLNPFFFFASMYHLLQRQGISICVTLYSSNISWWAGQTGWKADCMFWRTPATWFC